MNSTLTDERQFLFQHVLLPIFDVDNSTRIRYICHNKPSISFQVLESSEHLLRFVIYTYGMTTDLRIVCKEQKLNFEFGPELNTATLFSDMKIVYSFDPSVSIQDIIYNLLQVNYLDHLIKNEQPNKDIALRFGDLPLTYLKPLSKIRAAKYRKLVVRHFATKGFRYRCLHCNSLMCPHCLYCIDCASVCTCSCQNHFGPCMQTHKHLSKLPEIKINFFV